MLQYITNTASKVSVTDQIFAVIRGGCRWVQIRMKDASDEEISKVVEAVKPECEEKGVFLIMANKVELAKECNVGGVHLDKDDMPPSKARMILGPAAVIGVTAHTFADVLAVSQLDIDYYTLYPFRNESENASEPELGLEGIKNLCSEMFDKEINIPHVAAGGIKLEDALPLVEAGANGVAVSDAIAFADDIEKKTAEFVAVLPRKEGN